MKFTVKEDKYIQFGNDQRVFKKGKIYNLDDFQGSVRQTLNYIIRMNSTLFNIIKDVKPKVEPKNEPISNEVEDVVEEDNKQEETKEDLTQIETNEKSITEKELNDMTKQELIEFGESTLGLDIIVNNKKQEIYDRIFEYLVEQDLIESE